MNFRSHRRARPSAVLDIAPLIDIVFLLLIFFLITTTFVRRQEMVVTVLLPEGSAQPMPAEQEQLTIYVSPDGNYTLTTAESPDTGLSLDREMLRRELQTLYETDPNLAIFLRGDRNVNYGSVIEVLIMAREIGFERVQAVVRERRNDLAPP
jgi:biopolymer transport protein ExbD